MEAHKVIEIGILSEKEAWILFRQKAGNSADDPSLLDIAKDVMNECKGLPLAIITAAGAQKCKTKHSWEDALVQLQRSAPSNIPGVLTNMYQPLKLSYDHLESDEASNLGLSSKLTRFDLEVCERGYTCFRSSLMALDVTESTQLGDWIRQMLRNSECVRSVGKGSKNVLTELQVDGFQNEIVMH
ncbi:hypothetical protein RND71_014210 [Anisodus tanguticus]|uniref:NB-ARC domain-containing protein n=1 Tax=Anisodus tanguticus TaxID=243964 RepID=A0AAE1SAB1_9SOLA|nr:hypothetical protein RND71_014210 [Anisodus tanguticus]